MGVAYLFCMYSKLAEGRIWNTEQMIASYTLFMVILHPLLLLYHFHNTCVTPLLIIHMYHFQACILQYFPRISDWSFVDDYTEDWPHVCAFVLLRGNKLIEPFKVFLDHTIEYSINF